MPPKQQKGKQKAKQKDIFSSVSVQQAPLDESVIGKVISRNGEEGQYYWIDLNGLLEASPGDTLYMAKKSGGKDRQSGGTKGVEIFSCGGHLLITRIMD